MAAIKIGMYLKGAEHVKDNVRRLNRTLREAHGYGVYVIGAHIMDYAKELTPVATGALRDSAYITPPEASSSGRYTTMEMGFGGSNVGPGNHAPTSDYAMPQHENDAWKHSVGQSRYLLEAMSEYGNQGAAMLRKIMDEYAEIGMGRFPLFNVAQRPK